MAPGDKYQQRTPPKRLLYGDSMPKTFGNLAHLVYDFENLDAAFHDMTRGMRYRRVMIDYRENYEENIINQQNHLIWRTYKPKPQNEFIIHEPKERMISAPHRDDRLVQHALCRIIEPLFDHKFIYDSYACRKGKGSLAACKRVQHFIRCQPEGSTVYYLKVDFRKYFHSIPHPTIKWAVRRTIRDEWVLWLIDTIIDSYPQGLPIGSLTSQLLANVVLDQLDHYVTDGCGGRCYARYMDDIIIVSTDLVVLQGLFNSAIEFSSQVLGLEINLSKSHISVCEYTYDDGSKFEPGIDFAGYVIKRDNLYPRMRNVKKGERRLRKISEREKTGYAAEGKFRSSAASFTGQMKHCAWTPRVRKVIGFIEREVAV